VLGDSEKLRWGVVGVGRAGSARARAIQADHRSELVAVAHGRFAAEFPVPNVSVAELVGRVDALAVCSPTALHTEHVRSALGAGCHTVVEFPIAESASEAESLFLNAESKGLLLHVEHIELLLPAFTALAAQLIDPIKATLRMTKKGSGEESLAAMYGALVARLHNLHALSPIRSVEQASWSPGRLDVALSLEQGEARLLIECEPSFKRSTELFARSGQDEWSLQSGSLFRNDHEVELERSSVSLFAQDHLRVMERLIDDRPLYVSSTAVLEILECVESVAALVRRDP